MSEYRKGLDEASREIAPTGWFGFKVILCAMVVIIGLGAVGYVAGWFGEGARVAQQEFGARAALDKYMWFKDAAGQLDAKKANIEVYRTRATTMEQSCGAKSRSDWSRADKEQYNLWQTELAGMIASYNGLAAEYNSNMAKFNWSFANAGQLPKGVTEPLPREFRAYQTN